MDTPDDKLYLIFLRSPEDVLRPEEFAGLRQLDDGLYLLRSSQSRSKVYHAIKRAALPEGLLVASLDDVPKFKGMQEGALKWLRASG